MMLKKQIQKFLGRLTGTSTRSVAQSNRLENDTGKRIAWRIKRNRKFKASMQIDAWKKAIYQAENIERPRRLALYLLYKEALYDLHLLSQIRNRIIKTTGSPFALFSIENNEPDWEITRLLETNWFRKYMKYVLESIFWGHSLMEIGELIKAREGLPVQKEISDILLIPREHVIPETGEILLDIWEDDGIPYREPPYNQWLIEAGDPEDLGLLLPTVREVIWKLYSRTDWSQHSEKFGMPLLAMATAGMDPKEIDKMEEMAANFGSNGYVLIDDLDNIQIHETKKSDAYRIYLELCKYCDEQISKGILGGTALSDVKSFVGSAEVQERQADDLIEDDMRMVEAHVNERLIPLLLRLEYPLKGFEFRFISIVNDNADGADDGSNTQQSLKKKIP